ncbi:MAG: helix-turn-helix transcriptional regulator [Lentisphaeria bacterium]|nr:helix-turn-helix transcriptional regulator [Lentisphaeria bacterium]
MGTSVREEYYWGGDKSFSLYVRSCGEYTLNGPDRERTRLRTGFGEIFWPVEGEGVFLFRGRAYTLSPGHVWYYPPDSVHDFYPSGRFRYCWLTVAGPDAEKLFELMKIRPGLNRAGTCPVHLFRAAGDDLEFLSRRQGLNALAMAVRILAMISVMPPEEFPVRDAAVFNAKQIIELNFYDPELTVEKVASQVGMHRGSLARAFRKSYGVTVSEYLRSCKIGKAVELLSSTELPVCEIARACGMGSAHYFAKVFRSRTGVSPSVCRSRVRKDGDQPCFRVRASFPSISE